MNSGKLKEYKYNGARSMVLLHEQFLTSMLHTWREAKNLNIQLPKTDDSDYLSLETLLQHIFRSARGYMIWICDKLNLPDPEIEPAPESNNIENEANKYLSYLLDKWCLPLSDVEKSKFATKTYTSNWGIEYCIDAMLEHAVMHPIRHEFQLRFLINEQLNNE